MNNSRIVKSVFFFYLALAPINWIPFLPTISILVLKYLAFLVLFILSASVVNVKNIKEPFTFLSLLTILIFSIPGNMQAYTEVLLNIMDIAFIFAMNFVVANSMISKNELFVVFSKVALLIGIVCGFSILSAISGVTMSAPLPWRDSFDQSALGGYRTGWSNSIFLYIPLLFHVFFNGDTRRSKTWALIAIVAIVGSQILSGGRIGLIASVLTFFMFTRFKLVNILAVLIAIVVTVQFVGVVAVERHFRAADEQLEVKSGANDLDKFSSGRISSYKEGFALFLKSPFLGSGFGSNIFLLEGPEVHNTWLKRAIDGGLIYLIPLIIFFVILYREANKRIKRLLDFNKHQLLFHSLFWGAILISCFEPNYLIGSFQGEAFFWAVICCYFK